MLQTDMSESAAAQPLSVEQLNQLAGLGAWQEPWLRNLAEQLPSMVAGILLVKRGASLQPAATWPDRDIPLDQLGALVDECLQQQQPLVHLDEYIGVAYPVSSDTGVGAVVAALLVLPSRANAEDDGETAELQQQLVDHSLGSIERHCLWVESWLGRQAQNERQLTLERQRSVIDGFVAVGKGEALKESALQWMDTLARDFSCDRVCLGRVHRDQVSLEVISGSSDYALNSVTAKQIVKVMQEACDQRRHIAWPAIVREQGQEESVTDGVGLQAEKLSLAEHNASILSVPVYHGDDVYLIVTFERPAKSSFTDVECERIEANLALVGVAFQHRQQAELSLWGACKRSSKRQLERLLAPGYVKRKLFFISLFASVLFLGLARGEYQINADAQLEPRQIRVVSAPYNGYLKAAEYRAGDRVREGELLALMEDNELRLEKIKAISRLTQTNQQYSEALAGRERAQAQIFFAQMEQAKAHLSSTESRLERSQLKAPFDALIVSGDLSQRIGGSVNQGEELFRLSPMANYRLILNVSEYRIGDIQLQQKGRVVLSSMPDRGFEFVVEKLTPVTEVREGSTVFRVEARLLQTHELFRPGLVGIAKVSAGERLLVDIWTTDLRKWLALKLWSFWG